MTKVVLITGGTRGIGRALVDVYLRHGFAVATCSSNPENTRQLREAYPDEKKLYVATFDIQDGQAGRQFVKKVLDRWGTIQQYYFNSGICLDKSFSKMTSKHWQEVIAVNLTAAFDITQAVFEHMKAREGVKQIFFMTSSSGIGGAFGQANYAASKAGLIGLSQTLAIEGKRYDIAVNAIAPAALTDMTAPIIARLTKTCRQENRPFPSFWQIGTAEKAAESMYRLSTVASLGTGQIFVINGETIERYQPAVKTIYDLP